MAVSSSYHLTMPANVFDYPVSPPKEINIFPKNSKKMLQEKLVALKFLFNFNQPGGQFKLLPPRTWK